MHFILSRYNHNMDWMKDYPAEYVIYDRSEIPMKGSIPVKNIGSDLYDKFTYIIDHYDNLPDVAIYSKANIFKYVTKKEFDEVKDNKTFTPLLTQNHKTKMLIAYYKDGIYWEINNRWYLIPHPAKKANELMELLGIADMEYIPFSPGSNYILPKENILKHSKEFYKKLRGYLEWSVYPGEAQIMERGLYTLWKS